MNHTDLTNYLRSVSPAGQARNCLFVSKDSLDIAQELQDELEQEELDEEEHKVDAAVQAIIDRMKKKALKGARKKMRVVDGRKPKPSGDDAYAGSNPAAMRSDPDMRNRGAVAEEVHEYRNGRRVNRLVPRGTDPYDILTKEGGKRGKAISMHGKLTKRLDSLSPETRAKYRRLYGYRTAMGRLHPMMEAKKIAKVKKALKGVVRDVKRAGKGFVKALGTPQSNTDYQITGRKF